MNMTDYSEARLRQMKKKKAEMLKQQNQFKVLFTININLATS